MATTLAPGSTPSCASRTTPPSVPVVQALRVPSAWQRKHAERQIQADDSPKESAERFESALAHHPRRQPARASRRAAACRLYRVSTGDNPRPIVAVTATSATRLANRGDTNTAIRVGQIWGCWPAAGPVHRPEHDPAVSR